MRTQERKKQGYHLSGNHTLGWATQERTSLWVNWLSERHTEVESIEWKSQWRWRLIQLSKNHTWFGQHSGNHVVWSNALSPSHPQEEDRHNNYSNGVHWLGSVCKGERLWNNVPSSIWGMFSTCELWVHLFWKFMEHFLH